MKYAKHLLLLLTAIVLLGSCQPRKPAPPAVEAAIPLGPGSTVAISPDGQHLLVVRALAETNEGWLIQTDGKASYKLFDFTSTYLFAAFSPDSKSLAWSTGKVWLADLETSQTKVLLGDDTDSTGAIAWQPDGSDLVVELSGKLVRSDRQGKVLNEITAAESVRGLSWVKLPNGSEQVLYNSFPAEAPPFVAAVSPAGGDSRKLAEGEVFSVGNGRLFYANPSSEGSLLVVDISGETGKKVLVEAGVTGLAPRPPAFDMVAYVLQSGETANDLWLIPATGGTATQLTKDKPVLGPLWSPDGKHLYYSVFNVEAAEEEEPFSVVKLPVP